MTVPVTVSEHDLLGLLSIVSDHRADDPGDGLPLSLFEHLMQQVPCDEISFFGLDSQQQAVWFGQGIPATGNGDMDALREAPGVQPCGRRHPCLPGGGSRGGDLTPVLNLGQTRKGARP